MTGQNFEPKFKFKLQHQKDVAIYSFHISCNIKKMLQHPDIQTAATSKGCCSILIFRHLQHPMDVAVSWFSTSCNIKRMLQCPSFKKAATSKGCCSIPVIRQLQHQKDVAVYQFQRALTLWDVLRKSGASKEQWHSACAVKTWILAQNFVPLKKN